MRIQHEHLIIESNIPIAHILQLDMKDQLNEHGKLTLKAIIQSEQKQAFIQGHYIGQNIRFLAETNDKHQLIFSGQITTVNYTNQDDVVTVTIVASSYSHTLDRVPKRRSYQNTTMKFEDILTALTSDTQIRFNWQAGNDRSIRQPFIQYDETDWEFVKRLASHLKRPIHVGLHSERADIYVGVKRGINRTLDEATIVAQGIDEIYYQLGGYERDESRELYTYVKVRNSEAWQIGDWVTHNRGQMTVIHVHASFEQGELTFTHTLGARGYLRQRTIYANQLKGLNLEGVIRRAEKESIAIQLDIDETDQANYLWRWMPETGNLGYIMPEVGSRVVLTLPTKNEKTAYGSRILRTNNNSPVYEQVENKQWKTVADKALGLFPEQLFLAGKNQGVRMSLEDQDGIHLSSNSTIRLRAREQIHLRGKNVTITAPDQVLMQTSQGNVDMENNFNLFAPEGTTTSSATPHDPPVRTGSQAHSKTDNQLPFTHEANDDMPREASSNQDEISNMATGVLPKMTGGRMTGMNNITSGNQASKQSQTFASTGSLSTKGGSRVPKAEIDDTT